ncbi:MAG TPA: nuclear transport factor 2 family protein [Solirubrobacteraceae bacterium]|nr:nuclear transport factor 2 family protein [Solirubrobacteraceae bacterium]
MSTTAGAIIWMVAGAMNAHDLDALVACFQPDYESEQPLHPERGFGGREQVRKNYAVLFGEIEDFRADVLRVAAVGDEVWSEWRMHGTKADRTPFEYRGMTVWGLRDGLIAWARLFFEPVEHGNSGIDEATRRLVAPRR